MKILQPFGLSVLLVFLSCETDKQIITDPTDELRSNWDTFIQNWESENAGECAQMYFEDGVNIPNDAPKNEGREKIMTFYDFLFDMNISSEYRHQIESVSYSMNNAVELGSFEVDWVRNDSSTWTYKARTVTHWSKNERGEWKIKLFLFNKPPDN